MTNQQLIERLNGVERMASVSKLRRMLASPVKYARAILFRELNYKRNKKEKEVVAKTFFDTAMHLFLPSATDIYLTGGKSHNSELRLARFLIRHLSPGDTFVDVGAHYGYFTLLASKLIGPTGQVIAFEASPVTYRILQKNTAGGGNTRGFNLAVADENAEITFYEFPNLYAEYNTLDVAQFQEKEWFLTHPPSEIKIQSILLGEFLERENLHPKLIKIDVEGAEYKVIRGLQHFLYKNAPMVVVEYLSDERGNNAHREAENMLNGLGYQSCLIDETGNLQHIAEISAYLKSNNMESDNIVFVKAANAL